MMKTSGRAFSHVQGGGGRGAKGPGDEIVHEIVLRHNQHTLLEQREALQQTYVSTCRDIVVPRFT